MKVTAHGAEVGTEASSNANLLTAAGQPALPLAIDNSTLTSFPPVRSQGNIGSCAAFSTVYYMGLHMLGLARQYNNRDNADNTTKLSPKWAYNMVHGGHDDGCWFTDVMQLMLKNGGATWTPRRSGTDY